MNILSKQALEKFLMRLKGMSNNELINLELDLDVIKYQRISKEATLAIKE